jgi:PAS domain S-box-containing protein
MASSQPSILRQAILGQPQASTDGDPISVRDGEQIITWEKPDEPGSVSAVVRPPVMAPTPRSAPGHAGHMKLLFENAPVAMAMFDTDMRYLLANRRWLDDFKLAEVDVVGRSQYELFPTLHPGWRHVYERALGGQIVRSDRDAITQDGRPVVYRWEVRPWRHVDTTIGGVMISCERLYALAGGAASESEAPPQIGEALWQSPLPLLAMTAEGRIVRSSKGSSGMLRAGTEGGASMPFWQAFGSEDNKEVLRKHVLASLNSVLADGRAYAVIFTEEGDDGSATPTQWLVSQLEGGVQGVIGDVALVIGLPGLSPFSAEEAEKCERGHEELVRVNDQIARLQAAVKESADATGVARQRESRLRAVLDLAPCGLMVLDDHARPIYHNTHVALLLGRELRDGATVESWLSEGARDDLHHAEISRRWTEGVWRKHLTLPLALTASDGLLKEIEMRPVALPGGGLLVMMQDVTESRRSEEMLRSTEAKYRTLVHESPVPIILADRTGAVFDVNPAAETFLGHTRADLRRMSLDTWLEAGTLTQRATVLAEMQEHGERSSTIAARVIHRDGAVTPADLKLALVTDAGGQLLFSVHFFSPVREEKPEPAAATSPPSALASSDATGSLSQTQALLLLTTDMHGRIQEWSDDAAERFGYEAVDVVGRGLHMLFRPSDATGFYSEVLAIEASDGKVVEPVDWTFFHKSEGRQSGMFLVQRYEDTGLAVNLLEEITVFAPAGAPDTSAPQVSADVPPAHESATAEAPSNESARPAPLSKPTAGELSRERLLLGEAHHRVKNHLQIITSMLNLQMSTLHNDEARDALRSSQNRVRSIAALHQHLFELATGETADFKAFASGLITHLRECYQVGEDRVPLQLNVPDRTVPEEWLMPLALSLNEMVSNAFKHAFPGKREGCMRVELTWDDHEGELTVVDDGAGLPAGFTHHDSSGLGLKILRVFAGQIGGEVKIHSAPGQGAVFQLTFPVVLDDEGALPVPPSKDED